MRALISYVLAHYFDIGGRAGRREFWLWWLVNTVVFIALKFALPSLFGGVGTVHIMTGPFGPSIAPSLSVFQSTGSSPQHPVPVAIIVAQAIWVGFALLPSLTVAVRRLHDTGRSGWWVWLNVHPLGALALLVMFAHRSGPLNSWGQPL
jgi:uncharacterized membrane protein YhaH (DUF805 family)